MSSRILVVDLNNFARYPSIAIGYLTSLLRSDGFDVDVLAPLTTGLTGVPREPRPAVWGRIDQELRYRTAVSRHPMIRSARKRYATRNASKLAGAKDAMVAEFTRQLDAGYDAVLISTYLMYHPHCVAMGEICRDRGIPLVVGGAYFNAPEVAEQWMNLPGLTALIGGEVEPDLCNIVRQAIDKKAVVNRGVWHQNGQLTLDAPPLQDLDQIPFPDYRDFPWSKYPNVIVPIITGRGCGWGACSFCSDITSTVGRTFRSRSPENVLAEIAHQHEQHEAKRLVFTDLKLNSNLAMWRGIINGLPEVLPDAKWIAAVHVGAREENGLSREELEQARASGMVRVTTGLESGSQRVLDAMGKGTDLATTRRFLRDASKAGISVRTTMILGFPGEEAADLDASTAFLWEHEQHIERVSLNRFEVMTGTRFARQLDNKPDLFPQITQLTVNHQVAQISHHYRPTESRTYRRAVSRLLQVVHRINRRPLNEAAREFEGVM